MYLKPFLKFQLINLSIIKRFITVMWIQIRIRKDQKCLPDLDPQLEILDPYPGQDLKLDVNITKTIKKINFVILTIIRYGTGTNFKYPLCSMI
jgi:hypothetical protein